MTALEAADLVFEVEVEGEGEGDAAYRHVERDDKVVRTDTTRGREDFVAAVLTQGRLVQAALWQPGRAAHTVASQTKCASSRDLAV
ncbi:hypothetical protein [Amycolatopsis anabasis]|uniref:hypothetical protein n=1 Tax=Amycolatopsis anabasis TaxID=1840409 RepID=UPI001C55504B|nr:hypothetical protein [Amycolatopsis anabasis]